jgi:hypothetical protein
MAMQESRTSDVQFPFVKGLWMWLMVVRTTHRSYRHGATVVAQDPIRTGNGGGMLGRISQPLTLHHDVTMARA